MTFLYIILSYFAGVASVLGVLYFEYSLYREEGTTKTESPPEENQAVQFIEPEPLADKFKDGVSLNEIIK